MKKRFRTSPKKYVKTKNDAFEKVYFFFDPFFWGVATCQKAEKLKTCEKNVAFETSMFGL